MKRFFQKELEMRRRARKGKSDGSALTKACPNSLYKDKCHCQLVFFQKKKQKRPGKLQRVNIYVLNAIAIFQIT